MRTAIATMIVFALFCCNLFGQGEFESECGYDENEHQAGTMSHSNTGSINLALLLCVEKGQNDTLSLQFYLNELEARIPDYFDKATFGNFTVTIPEILVKERDETQGIARAFVLPETLGSAFVVDSELVEAMLDSADQIYDFNDFDSNGDGYVDFFAFYVVRFAEGSNTGTIGLPLSVDYVTNDISNVTSEPIKISRSNGKATIQRFKIADADRNMRLLFHEMGHALFHFPDMGHAGLHIVRHHYALGGFEVMSLSQGIGGGFNGRASLFNPYFRYKMGWVEPEVLSTSDTKEFTDFDETGLIYQYVTPDRQNPVSNQNLFITYFSKPNDIYWQQFWPIPEHNGQFRGLLIWRSLTNSWSSTFGYSNRYRLPISIESAHGKWNWEDIDAFAYDAPLDKRPINTGVENQITGADSLMVRNSYIWFKYNPNTGSYEVQLHYPDYRIGSASIFFDPLNPQEFAFYTNPTSNIALNSSSLNYPRSITSDFKLYELRVENGIVKANVKIGNDAYIITEDATLAEGKWHIYNTITIASGVTLTIPEGTEFVFYNDAELIVEGTLHIEDDFSIPENSALRLTAGSAMINNGNLTIASGAELIIEPGVTVKMGEGWNNRITVNGTITSVGTEIDPIHFKREGGSAWNRVSVTNGSADIRWTVFEGGGFGALTLKGDGNFISNCTFKNNEWGLVLDGVTNATVEKSTIRDNQYEGLLVFDTEGDKNNWIRYNTITDNGAVHNVPNVYIYNSELDNYYRNVVENSSGRGIDVLASSNLYFQEQYDDIMHYPGYNRVKDNESHQIYITWSSRALLGYVIQGRYNTVYHTSGPTSSRKYIYNLAVSGPGYSGSPITILARSTYWGTYPSSGMFQGPVDYTDWLTEDYTGDSGAPPGQTPMMIAEENSGESKDGTIITVLSAGIIDAITSTYNDNENRGEELLLLKERIMELRNLLSEYPTHPHCYRWINELYTLSLLDREDMVREADNIKATYRIWSERRHEMDSTYRDLPATHLAIETALLLEIRKSIRSGEYGDAGELIAEYAPYISNLDHRMALLKNVIAVYSHNNKYAAALEILEHLESIEPEEDVAAWYSPPNFQPVSLYLTDAMEREGAGASGSFRVADMGSKYIAETIPVEYALSHNYPNPFNPVTSIRFSLPEQSNVRLEVYNTLGQRVKVLIADELYEPGVYSFVWNGVDQYNRQVASGQYIYRIVAGDFVESRRMVLIR